MTNEITELRRWSAEDLMEWRKVKTSQPRDFIEKSDYHYENKHEDLIIPLTKWTPDLPESGQIWLVVEKMRKKGYHMTAISTSGKYCSRFIKDGNLFTGTWHMSDNPCHAILLAAKAALEA